MPQLFNQPSGTAGNELIRRHPLCGGDSGLPSPLAPSFAIPQRLFTSVCSRNGFSVLELIIVVLILGILAAIAVPAYSQSILRYRADFAARRLQSDLEYASTLARTTSTEICIKFLDNGQPGGGYYWFETIEDPQRPGSLLTVLLKDEPYRVELSQSPPEIWFDVYGRPLNSEVWVINFGTQHERTVSIDKNTGEITVQ